MLTGKPRRASGVTLIELLIVLVLLGLLAGLAVPSLTRLAASLRSQGALDRLVADLNLARILAVREGRTVELRLAAGADGCVHSYSLRRRDPPSTLKAVELASELPGLCLRHGGNAVIAFNSRGLVRSGAQTLWVQHGARADSVVISFAGRVRRSY